MLRLYKSVSKAQNQNKPQKTIQKTIILFQKWKQTAYKAEYVFIY